MPRIKRLPYIADQYSFQKGDSVSFSIWRQKEDDPDESGVPIDLAFFIHLHCSCAICEAPITHNLSRCDCNEPKNAHLLVKFPVALYLTKFKPIREREGRRIHNQSRKRWKVENGGSYSKEDIANLYRIQEGLCYFCAKSISAKEGAGSFHIDHYHALSDGGTNDRCNIVLTCASCNRRKSNMHGDTFERRVRKTRDPTVGRKLGVIRRKITAYLGPRSKERPRTDIYDELRKEVRKGLNKR